MRNHPEEKDFQEAPLQNNSSVYLLVFIGVKVWLACTVFISWKVGLFQGLGFLLISLLMVLSMIMETENIEQGRG
jgi:hypothetical protein